MGPTSRTKRAKKRRKVVIGGAAARISAGRAWRGARSVGGQGRIEGHDINSTIIIDDRSYELLFTVGFY